jgi:hypothetical protein
MWCSPSGGSKEFAGEFPHGLVCSSLKQKHPENTAVDAGGRYLDWQSSP